MGYIRIQDLSSIITEMELKPVDVVTNNHKRNPHRVLPIESAEVSQMDEHFGGGSSDGEDIDVTPLMKEGSFR